MSSRTVGGILLAIAAFMLYGFLRSSASVASPAAIGALLLTVVLPAAGGIMLWRGGFSMNSGRSKRVEQLRQQTFEAEILRLATQHGGRLTTVDVATALALPAETAKATLDRLVEREVADLEITDDGVLVYYFHDAKYIGGKHGSRDLLGD
jgi:hypothetical protein